MILNKYILKNFIKVQIAILGVLLLIFEFQQIIRILNDVVVGDIPNDLILQMAFLGIPFMLQLIIPLSVLLAIIIVLSKLHTNSEIVAMQACGAGNSVIYKPSTILIIVNIIFALLNAFWLSPWSLTHKNLVLEEAQKNPKLQNIANGRFVDFVDDRFVLFAEDKINDNLKGIYIFQIDPYKKLKPSVTVAEQGTMTIKQKNRELNLNNAMKYEGSINKDEFSIINIKTFTAFLEYKKSQDNNDELSKEKFTTLWKNSNKPEQKLELLWRFNLVLVIFIMGIIAIPLSYVEARKGSFAKILPALLIFMIYFLLQNSIKKAGINFYISKFNLMMLVNIIFITCGIFLNLKYCGFFNKKNKVNKG